MGGLLSLYLPNWSIDLAIRRWKRQASSKRVEWTEARRTAVLLTAIQGDCQIVRDGCPLAAAAGVRPGMALAHARALLSATSSVRAVRVGQFDPSSDAAALHRLAVWSTCFAPHVAPDVPDGLLMDARGCHRLYGDGTVLLDRLSRRVARMGFQVRIAMAPTFGGAWAVARFGGRSLTVTASSQLRRTLASLPIESLRLEAVTCKALHEVGITHVTHLMAMERKELAERFDDVLLRLDQALGEAFEMIHPVSFETVPRVEQAFAGPVKQLEVIQKATRHLLVELCQCLEQRQVGARRIIWRAERSDLPAVQETCSLSRPSRNADHLWSLLVPHVERSNMGFGIERIVLSAWPFVPLPLRQDEVWMTKAPAFSPGEELGKLIDTLTARLGRDGVVRAESVATHIPEQAFRMITATNATGGAGESEVSLPDRPSLLFLPPHPVRAVSLVGEGPPSQITWNRRTLRVVVAIGPERIGAKWWQEKKRERSNDLGEAESGTRDYFQVADEAGQWWWVFRILETGQWFMHGRWV